MARVALLALLLLGCKTKVDLDHVPPAPIDPSAPPPAPPLPDMHGFDLSLPPVGTVPTAPELCDRVVARVASEVKTPASQLLDACRKEGISAEQASCVLDRDLKDRASCPALIAKPMGWMSAAR